MGSLILINKNVCAIICRTGINRSASLKYYMSHNIAVVPRSVLRVKKVNKMRDKFSLPSTTCHVNFIVGQKGSQESSSRRMTA